MSEPNPPATGLRRQPGAGMPPEHLIERVDGIEAEGGRLYGLPAAALWQTRT